MITEIKSYRLTFDIVQITEIGKSCAPDFLIEPGIRYTLTCENETVVFTCPGNQSEEEYYKYYFEPALRSLIEKIMKTKSINWINEQIQLEAKK